MIDEALLKYDELAVTKLRSLYDGYGYKPYKMSKFEEYELYIANKDFLVSDKVITFNDTNGKLLALKPDVTLSIIKNLQSDNCKQKLYYNENVYRVSQTTGCFKEIMQAGLECIGEIDIYDIFEVIMLASKSLKMISEDFVLEVSNLSIIESAIKKGSNDEIFKQKALKFIESKNTHDLVRLCEEYRIEATCVETLLALIRAYGNRKKVIESIKKFFSKEEIKDIVALSALLDLLPFSDKIIFDFSVAGNANYYNGFIFHGFINTINGIILSGGQYDKMMKKMSKKIGAIGFAIYLDLLEELSDNNINKNIDCVILYDNNTDLSDIINISDKKTENGKTILIVKEIDTTSKYNEIIDLRGKMDA